ncbi:MAG: peptidoglycan DD-metalloendopeptidase family protein [Rhodothermia bacterium]|nr:MAG: peptidoglycan DD-metalloendopeptidase family protein [Rhodothermia bacterium]
MPKRLLFTVVFFLILAVIVFLMIKPGTGAISNESADIAQIADESPEQPVEFDEYGFSLSEYERIDAKIGRNQTFADLLVPHNIPYDAIVEIAAASKSVFDIRRLRADNRYRIYRDDSLGTPLFMVYQQDRIRYVVFDLHDGLDARVEERPVTVKEKSITGVINSSLYETLLEQGASPILANELAEVYAWQIDFYRTQRGDYFKVIYDELWVGDDRIGIGKIHAARFNHMGSDNFAFHFQEDDIDEHYDETGASLRKAFLIAPVRYSRISSGFTSRRYHPVQKIYTAHLGTDYVAPYGTPIRATGDGVVEEARYSGSNGNWVKIRHNGTYTTGYLHMSRIAKGMRPGVNVKQGQIIGYVGHTGLATGDHVDYRFWKNGSQVNHRRQKIPSVGPIPDQYRNSFEKVRDTYLAVLSVDPEILLAPAYAMLLGYPQEIGSSGP